MVKLLAKGPVYKNQYGVFHVDDIKVVKKQGIEVNVLLLFPFILFI